MNAPPAASLLMAVYNAPEYFRRTLYGLTRQLQADFETIICDDGSGPEIRALVEEFTPRLPGSVRHCRQSDRGFRKCRILNEGVLAARSDYLIFLDADCIPHRRFVTEHLRCRKPDHFLAGRRVLLSDRLTRRLDDEMVLSGRLERVWFWGLPDTMARRTRWLEAGFYCPPLQGLLWALGIEIGVQGCNFSCWKSDLERINGFDEEFESAGAGEDWDVERRFRLAGLKERSVKYRALCYHQHHATVSRARSIPLRDQRRRSTQIACDRGLSQHKAGAGDGASAGG